MQSSISTAAIKAFQVTHGLVSDGIAGPKTKTALVLALSPTATTPPDLIGFGGLSDDVAASGIGSEFGTHKNKRKFG